MRVAYEQEREGLAGAAVKNGGALSILFVYKGVRQAQSARIALESIRGDMNSICRKICAAEGRGRI